LNKPIVVSIPHRLGKDEAIRRLKRGLGSVRTEYRALFQVQQEIWSGERLAFNIIALGQSISGTMDVADDYVRLELTLPLLLAAFARGVEALIRKRGLLLLEKK
jgi:Putative polyhydroxyalkanoic acid system protein (PHA_gran_rgn)